MLADLKNEIRAALSGSSAQKPVDTVVLTKGHHRRRVEAVLMEMYQAREVCCCKIIKGGSESVVWWIAGNAPSQPQRYGKQAAPKNPTTPKQAARRVVRRTSDFTENVLTLITAQPGMNAAEICRKHIWPDDTQRQAQKIYDSIQSLIKRGRVHKKGESRECRYFPGEQA